MSLLDKIVAAKGAVEPVRVRVPEWDTDLYFNPVTPAERARIRRGIKPNDVEAFWISTLQHKALLADGTPAFTPGDLKEREKLLASADLSVVLRILREGSIEDDPRREMLEAASLDDIRLMLADFGDLPGGAMADLSDEIVEAARALASAREYEIEARLGGSDDAPSDPVTVAKNG